MSRKTLQCLLALCGLLTVRSPCAADAAATPLAAKAEAAFFSIRQGDLLGLIDAKGRVVLPAEFNAIILGQPLTLVRKGQRTAHLDGTGRMVVGPQDHWTLPYAEGLMPAGGKDAQGRARWGYVDGAGAWAIAPACDSAWPFSEGLAVVKVGNLHGYIDKHGKTAIALQCSFARPFSQGLAYVGAGRSSSCIRPDGQAVWRREPR